MSYEPDRDIPENDEERDLMALGAVLSIPGLIMCYILIGIFVLFVIGMISG